MKILDKIKLVFYINDPPSKTALTFSIGLFIGLSPLLGLHTLISLAIAFIFRLNKFVILLGTYVTNPWTLIPIYTFSTLLGARILGRSIKIEIDWYNVTLSSLFHLSSNILLPFITGTLIVGAVSSVLSYLIIYLILSKSRQKNKHAK
ncbi:MAG: DUF2062 domain-containing protein [Thermodesulfovibrionales bacterium]|nr:DUF2062 domain-containing protein [Thermodesulfovibrionales bacterium]